MFHQFDAQNAMQIIEKVTHIAEIAGMMQNAQHVGWPRLVWEASPRKPHGNPIKRPAGNRGAFSFMLDQRTKIQDLQAAKRSRETLERREVKRKARREKIERHKANHKNKKAQQSAPYNRQNFSARFPKYRPGMGSEFYDTREWKELRYNTIKRLGLICACCGAKGKEVQFHVDHIKPRSRFPMLELEEDNLQILCEPCNIGKGNRDSINWQNERAKAGQ